MTDSTIPDINVEGTSYQRLPIRTHLIGIKEPLLPVIDELVKPRFMPGDWLAISEKVVTISQGRVIHISEVKPSLLARLIVKGVKKYPHDIGYSHPAKMQVAIMQAGYPRMAAAMIFGSITRLLGRHGDFYRIAGHHISEIDGFNPAAIPPFDQYAMLGPAEPDQYCQEIEDKLGVPAVIIDGNNINVEVLGASAELPVSRAQARLILLDNPMGQENELTPFILVRKVK